MACFASRYLWPFSESEWCVQCRPWLGKGVFGLKSRSKLVPNDWSGQIIIAISVTTRALNFGSWGLGKSHLFQGNLAWWNFLTWAVWSRMYWFQQNTNLAAWSLQSPQMLPTFYGSSSLLKQWGTKGNAALWWWWETKFANGSWDANCRFATLDLNTHYIRSVDGQK